MRVPVQAPGFQTFLNVVVASLVGASPLLTRFHNDGEDILVVPTVIITIIAVVAVLFRWRYPLAAFGVVLASGFLTQLTAASNASVVTGVAVVLYSVVIRSSRRTSAILTAITLVMIISLIALGPDDSTDWGAGLGVSVWVALAAALGDSVRSRRNYVQVLRERAERAEQTREQVARTRVAEERLRIARELHDVVAHHIAVVNIQAGLASRALSREATGTASDAIDRVSEAARSALDDLSAILRLLRTPEDVERRDPAPGLAQLSDLIQSYGVTDDRVHWKISGRAVPLDAACELTAYRVIQEALTNATKHGVPGDTHLSIAYETDRLTAVVSNRIRTDHEGDQPRTARTGYGVIGLHERVGSVGGTITTDRQPDGRFVVRAVIPFTPVRQDRGEPRP